VDCTRVYHFGARYNVEMEIVLPGAMTVMESHDIALALQHKIESMEDVERAFVHVRVDALSMSLSLDRMDDNALHLPSIIFIPVCRWITRSGTGWNTRWRGS